MPKRKRSAPKKQSHIKEEDVKQSIESPEPDPSEAEPEEEEDDDDDMGWTVAVKKQHKKGGTSQNELPEFGDIGKDLQYTVFLNDHKGAWEQMQSYKRWNMDQTDLEYTVGDTIAVLYTEPEKQELPNKKAKQSKTEEQDEEERDIELVSTLDPEVSLEGCGIAKVLECRALDNEHVYLRIVWLYRPEDTHEGRQPWHAENELLPSNHMQIVEATTCNGKVSVRKWEPEAQGEVGAGGERDFVWRQTVDTTGGKQRVSAVERYCRCERPADLSGKEPLVLLRCTDLSEEKCGKWQHVSCLVEATRTQLLSTKAGLALLDSSTKIEPELGELPDPFQKTGNGIKGSINSFTAGLVGMLTSSTPAKSGAAKTEEDGGTPQTARKKGRGRAKKESLVKDEMEIKKEEEPAAAAGVETTILQDVVSDGEVTRQRMPVVHLQNASGASVRATIKCFFCGCEVEGHEGFARYGH